MKIITIPIGATNYIQSIEGDANASREDLKKNSVYVKVKTKDSEIYWVVEDEEEYQWIKNEINPKNEMNEKGSLSRNISLVILKNCPTKIFQPMRKAHLSPHIDVKVILEKAELIEKKAKGIATKKQSRLSLEKINLEYVLSHLPGIYEESDGNQFHDNSMNQFIAKLLLSIHWLDGGGWQLAGDLINDPTKVYYYAGTGVGAGSIVFLVALIEILAIDLPKVKRGDLALGECLMSAFGNASMYGVAASLSNALWLALANKANEHGEDEIKTFIYTSAGCAVAFLAALICIKAIHRALEGYQAKKILEKMTQFFKQDLPHFSALSVDIATSAAAFCFILFPKILGMSNIFVINPTQIKDFATNALKSAATTYIGFWLGEIIKSTISNLIPWKSEGPLNEEKILKELDKQIRLNYPDEKSGLLIENN